MQTSRERFMMLIKTTVLALFFQVIPIPFLADAVLPLWGLLFFSYWLMFYGRTLLLLAAFMVGLLIDLVMGDILAQNALALVISSGILIKIKRRFLFSGLLMQQVFMVLVAMVYVLVYLGVYVALGNVDVTLLVLFAPLTSGIMWLAVGFFQSR